MRGGEEGCVKLAGVKDKWIQCLCGLLLVGLGPVGT